MDIVESLSAIQEPITAIPTETILRYGKYIFGENKKVIIETSGRKIKEKPTSNGFQGKIREKTKIIEKPSASQGKIKEKGS